MHIFTSSKIASSKQFKKNIFDKAEFTNQLYLLVVDKIYLMDQQRNVFCLLYTEIKKV